MSKFELIFGLIILAMLTTIIVLCYQVGADMTVVWCLLVPLVVVRFIRAILLIRTKD
jgi:hypothetical protein